MIKTNTRVRPWCCNLRNQTPQNRPQADLELGPGAVLGPCLGMPGDAVNQQVSKLHLLRRNSVNDAIYTDGEIDECAH